LPISSEDLKDFILKILDLNEEHDSDEVTDTGNPKLEVKLM
jgi:hypothetical protein